MITLEDDLKHVFYVGEICHYFAQAKPGKIVEIGNGKVRVGFDSVTGLLA